MSRECSFLTDAISQQPLTSVRWVVTRNSSVHQAAEGAIHVVRGGSRGGGRWTDRKAGRKVSDTGCGKNLSAHSRGVHERAVSWHDTTKQAFN